MRASAPGGEVEPVDQLVLEGTPEGLHDGFVVAVGLAAHRGRCVVVGQHGAIGRTGVLDAAIGVMEESSFRSTLLQGHPKGGDRRRRVEGVTLCPAHKAPAASIQDSGHAEPAFVCMDIGHVSYPDAIRPRGRRDRGRPVWRDGLVVPAIRRDDPISPLLTAPQAYCAHETGDAVSTDSFRPVLGDPGDERPSRHPRPAWTAAIWTRRA